MSVVDALVGRVIRVARWLILPVVVLLFLQWPLREWVHLYSREANDLGQWLFALFIACSITAATRAGTHLKAADPTGGYRPRTRRALAIALPLVVLAPWAILVLVAGWPSTLSSIRIVEHFPETGNPGYVLIKVAAMALAALVLLQAILDLARSLRSA